MKILHMIGMPSSKYGSIERFFIEQMRQLPDSQILLVYNSQPASKEYLADIQHYRGGYRVLQTGGLAFVKNVFAYIRLLREFKPDVVHFHFGFSFPLYAPIARLMGVKALFQTEHLCLTYGPKRKQVTKKSELRLVYGLVFLWGWALKPFDRVVCVGKHVQHQFETIFNVYKHYETIHMGVPDARHYTDEEKRRLRAELRIPDGAQVITTTAFAVWLKGGDVFVSALPLLKDPNYVALIIGFDEEIPFTRELHEMADRTGIADRIRWIGITDNVSRYLAISDIYVQSSRTEALTLSVNEAQSYSLPCVGSKVGGLPEICNLLFESEDSAGLAHQLDSLMASPELRQRLGTESRHAYETEFKQSCGVAAYTRLYRSVLAAKQSASHKPA